MVGIMGFTALAVDLGRVYAERRRAQNAADSAAYAAAIAGYLGNNWATAGLNQAAQNDYHDNDPNRNPSQLVDVEVYHPAVSGPYADASRADYKEYYQVFIHSHVDAVFAQFVYAGALNVTVEAVTRYTPVKGLFPGDALVATNKSACKAVWFQGTAGTNINGGNIFSNSDRSGTPATCFAGVQNGSGSISVTDGGISTVGGFLYNASSVYAQNGITQSPQQDIPVLPIPDCADEPSRTYQPLQGNTPGPNVLQPGFYHGGIKVNGGESVRLQSGMYCLGSDFTMLGGDISDVPDPATGRTGVFIVMLNGNFNLSGNTIVNINRMDAFTDKLGQPWHGMLLYMPYLSPYLNDGTVFIGGGGNSTYTGTIFAPGPAHSGYKCVIEGSGTSIGLSSNVICDTIFVTGNASVIINYNEKQNFRMRPSTGLFQ